ncbi:MAG: pilus assembly protein TadG-related protein [Bryobacterales bacterium]|nr:pilus assembly protein TadG-related protein [Bryobacterales bacterium]
MGDRRSQSGRKGFVAITTAVMLIGLLAFAGLAIDIGYLELTRRRAQVAADAAAMGAGLEAQRGGTEAVLEEAGRADSALNGFTHGRDSTTVTVNHPPLTGRLAGSSRAVEAVVTRSVPTFFLGVIGQNGATVRARAVGTVGAGTACIFALNKHLSGAMTISGSTVPTAYCDALVSSDSETAYNMNGGSRLDMGNHARVGTVGGWSPEHPNVWDIIDNRQVDPEHTIDRGDPLAHVVAPTPGSLPVQSGNQTGVQPNTTVALNPGVYCGGMDIKGTANLAPGVYILAGGGLTTNALAVIIGTGVTIYNTSSTGWGCPGGFRAPDEISINGGATLAISAPTDGALAGMAFFQDRTIISTETQKFNGGANMVIDGAIYFPNSPMQFTGSSSNSGYTYLVADTVEFTGNSTLRNNTSSLAQGSPLRVVATVAE